MSASRLIANRFEISDLDATVAELLVELEGESTSDDRNAR